MSCTRLFCVFATVLGCFCAQVRGSLRVEVQKHSTCAGLVYNLKCAKEGFWTRDVNMREKEEIGNSSSIQVMNRSLWFFPANLSHSGNYTCWNNRTRDRPIEIFSLSVQTCKCPPPSRDWPLSKSLNGDGTCGQGEILKLDPRRNITWLKNCTEMPGMVEKVLRFKDVSETDEGLYTCLIKFHYQGQQYEAADTVQLYIEETEPTRVGPQVLEPKRKNMEVYPGQSVQLSCSMFSGMNEEDDVMVYWKHEGNLVEGEIVNKFWCSDNGHCSVNTALHISEVQPEMFRSPFQCIVETPIGTDSGEVALMPASWSWLYVVVGTGMACSVTFLIILAVTIFKVDLVLVYRELCPLVGKHKLSDGKLYDAYVSYLHGDALCCTSLTTTFALQTLPEMLEHRYGYKLFISGRDDLPGEAFHDVISERLQRSRRLVIILTSQSLTPSSSVAPAQLSTGTHTLPDSSNQLENVTVTGPETNVPHQSFPERHSSQECFTEHLLQTAPGNWGQVSEETDSSFKGLAQPSLETHTHPEASFSSETYCNSYGESLFAQALSRQDYEQRLGVYDALVDRGLRVILIETEGPVDESLLPPPLRLVSRSQGILRWKPSANGRFWKHLRYRMPVAPKQNKRTWGTLA